MSKENPIDNQIKNIIMKLHDPKIRSYGDFAAAAVELNTEHVLPDKVLCANMKELEAGFLDLPASPRLVCRCTVM